MPAFVTPFVPPNLARAQFPRPSVTPARVPVFSPVVASLPLGDPTTRLHQTRLRLHLLQLSSQQRRQPSPSAHSLHEDRHFPYPVRHMQANCSDSSDVFRHHPESLVSSDDITSQSSQHHDNQSARTPSYSTEERSARSERLRALWRDPEWREAMLAKRRSKETVRRKSEAAKRLWSDPEWRQKMCDARVGRPAPNKGVPASSVTRLRMSAAHRGRKMSDETRRRMSSGKRNRPANDSWPKLLSDSRKGKTRQYFAMRREFRALHRDLKLWSDSHKARYGRLPDASSYERLVAPMMVLRIRRYLMLRDTFASDEDYKTDIISPR